MSKHHSLVLVATRWSTDPLTGTFPCLSNTTFPTVPHTCIFPLLKWFTSLWKVDSKRTKAKKLDKIQRSSSLLQALPWLLSAFRIQYKVQLEHIPGPALRPYFVCQWHGPHLGSKHTELHQPACARAHQPRPSTNWARPDLTWAASCWRKDLVPAFSQK